MSKWNEQARIAQKRRRAAETKTREAMLRWGNGPLGKAARERYMKEGDGKAVVSEARKKGTPSYSAKKRKWRESIAKADMANKEWTAKEEHRLLEAMANGKTWAQAGAMLGRSLKSVGHKLRRLRSCDQLKAGSNQTEVQDAEMAA